MSSSETPHSDRTEELLEALRESAKGFKLSTIENDYHSVVDADARIVAKQEEAAYDKDRAKMLDDQEYRKSVWEQRYNRIMGNLRIWYSVGIFVIVTGWIVVVAWCVLAVGYAKVDFSLSDAVLVSLVGGMTVNVIGMIFIILKFFFPNTDSS